MKSSAWKDRFIRRPKTPIELRRKTSQFRHIHGAVSRLGRGGRRTTALVFEGLFGRQRSLETAADASEKNPAPRRPVIGLALGGGAARGFAHIGIIRVLVE